MRIDSRIILCTVLLAAVALSVSCSDDDSSNPVSAAPEEIVLATFTSGGSSSGPDQPPQPYAMVIQVGVDDHVLPGYGEMPDPMLFSDRTFEDNTNYIARQWNVMDFATMADRLTDGEDNTAFVSMHTISGGGSSNWGYESSVFNYEPGLSRIGPDLIGYEVTGVQVELDIEVTENAGWWTQAHTCTIRILGH